MKHFYVILIFHYLGFPPSLLQILGMTETMRKMICQWNSMDRVMWWWKWTGSRCFPFHKNYLTSNDQVNGLIIEDAWFPWEPYVTDACVWFRRHREWVWQYLNNTDRPYSFGGSNQFAFGCTGPAGCQSFWPHVTFGAHVLFMSCWCGVCACGWDYMHNRSDSFCMEGVLNAFSSCGFSDESL